MHSTKPALVKSKRPLVLIARPGKGISSPEHFCQILEIGGDSVVRWLLRAIRPTSGRSPSTDSERRGDGGKARTADGNGRGGDER
jgi:hypothetical protein